jgi:hypothetical protein
MSVMLVRVGKKRMLSRNALVGQIPWAVMVKPMKLTSSSAN